MIDWLINWLTDWLIDWIPQSWVWGLTRILTCESHLKFLSSTSVSGTVSNPSPLPPICNIGGRQIHGASYLMRGLSSWTVDVIFSDIHFMFFFIYILKRNWRRSLKNIYFLFFYLIKFRFFFSFSFAETESSRVLA